MALLEAIEDRVDIAQARKALAEARARGTVRWADLKAELGLWRRAIPSPLCGQKETPGAGPRTSSGQPRCNNVNNVGRGTRCVSAITRAEVVVPADSQRGFQDRSGLTRIPLVGKVVVTGIGLVTGLAPDREGTWQRLLAGESAIGPLSLFDTTGFRTSIGAQVDDARLGGWPGGDEPRLGRVCRMALAATAEALGDAGLPLLAGPRPWPVVLGGGASGISEAERFIAARLRHGRRVAGARHLLEVPHDSPADRISQVFGLSGPRTVVITACSSATIAIGLAADMVANDEAACAIAGGADGITRTTYAGFNSLRVVDAEPCKPFDLRRRGMSFGEGGAILVLEGEEHARRRGARPYATILGYGMTDDAYHMTKPDPTGRPWQRTIMAALDDAGVSPAEIDYINAHGTATEQNDAAECAAFGLVLGARLPSVPISSSKGAVGHCLCAAGAVEAAIATLAVARQTAPPTVGFAVADPACPIDPVPGRGRAAAIRCAVSTSFAFGGNAGALVFGKVT